MIDAVTKKGIYHRSMPQDYVIAEDLGTASEPLPFIAVADGCSAGRFSERGAMILCCAAKRAIAPYLLSDPETLLHKIIQYAGEAADALGLGLDDMIATLRLAYVYQDTLYTIETGDGFSFQIFYDGRFAYQQYEYEINAPFYLAYKIFNQVDEYRSIGRGNNQLIVTKGNSFEAGHHIEKLPSTEIIYKKIEHISEMQAKFYGLATDGLSSYLNEGSGSSVPAIEVIRRLSDIKVPAGEFLVRRFQKLDKELTNAAFENHDDIGIAMINLDCYRETIKRNKP